MKTTLMSRFAIRSTIGLGIALLAGCAGNLTEAQCEATVGGDCEGLPSGPQEVTVNVTGEGGGHGGVAAANSMVGINCQIASNATGQASWSGDCSRTFQDAGLGGAFALTATPLVGYYFGGWSRDCSGTSSVCTLSFPAGPDVTFNVIARFYPRADS